MLCAKVQLDHRYNREVTAIGIQSLQSYPICELPHVTLANNSNISTAIYGSSGPRYRGLYKEDSVQGQYPVAKERSFSVLSVEIAFQHLHFIDLLRRVSCCDGVSFSVDRRRAYRRRV